MSAFVSFSTVNVISFSSVFSFMAENEKCFSVGRKEFHCMQTSKLWYTSQKGLGLEMQSLDVGLEH